MAKSNKQAVEAPVKEAPKVVLEKDGCRVRLRGADIPLTGCLSVEDGQEIRFELPPDRWVTVHPRVAEMLRLKFARPKEVEVPDWIPGGPNDMPRSAPRVERRNDPIIEFPEER